MDQTVSDELLDHLQQLVAEVERDTAAEVVVVIAGRSGSYRDLAILAGASCAALTLLALLYLPLSFPSASIVPLTALAGLLGAVGCARSPGLLRRLALVDRRAAQVQARAREVFFDEAVSGTRDRTGVLIYVSRLEDAIEVLTDHGIDARVPRGRWNTLVDEARREAAPGRWDEALDTLLTRAAPLLAEHVPASDDNPDEIPNRPRVLP